MQQEGTTQKGTGGAIVMRAKGKSFGSFDPKTLRWSTNRGRVRVTFDLRESARTGRPVIVKPLQDFDKK